MSDNEYSMCLQYNSASPNGEWCIYRRIDGLSMFEEDKIVWRRAQIEDEPTDGRGWPADMRSEYERLTGKPEFSPCKTFIPQPVELLDDSEGSGFNQPCMYGYLVEGHSVYCHNDGWLYSPRKCRRTWYTGGKIRDEDCPGFCPHKKD